MNVFWIETVNSARPISFDSYSEWPAAVRDADTALAEIWHCPTDGFVYDSRVPATTFYHLCGWIVFEERVLENEGMRALFESVGELLPFTLEGQRCYVLNIPHRCRGIVNQERSVWRAKPNPATGFRGTYESVCLDTRKIDRSLFRIAEKVGIFCVDEGCEPNFYRLYHEAGYTGLTFLPVQSI